MIERGYRNQFHYANEYGASVVSSKGSMGGEHGYFELAVLHGDHDGLCFSTPVTEGVIGWLSFDEVTPILDKIRYLGENPRCNHQAPTTSSIEDRDEDEDGE